MYLYNLSIFQGLYLNFTAYNKRNGHSHVIDEISTDIPTEVTAAAFDSALVNNGTWGIGKITLTYHVQTSFNQLIFSCK